MANAFEIPLIDGKAMCLTEDMEMTENGLAEVSARDFGRGLLSVTPITSAITQVISRAGERSGARQ